MVTWCILFARNIFKYFCGSFCQKESCKIEYILVFFSANKLWKNATNYAFTTHKLKVTRLFLGTMNLTPLLFLLFSLVFCCLNMFKQVWTCLLPWLIIRKMHYKIRCEYSRTLKDDKTITPIHPYSHFYRCELLLSYT